MGDLSGRQWLFFKKFRSAHPAAWWRPDGLAKPFEKDRIETRSPQASGDLEASAPGPPDRKNSIFKELPFGPAWLLSRPEKAAAGLAPWHWPFDFLEIYQVVSGPKAAAVPMAAHIVGSAAPVNRLFCGNVKSARQTAANALELQSKIRSSRSRHGYRIHDVRLPKLRESPAQHPLLTPARLGNRA